VLNHPSSSSPRPGLCPEPRRNIQSPVLSTQRMKQDFARAMHLGDITIVHHPCVSIADLIQPRCGASGHQKRPYWPLSLRTAGSNRSNCLGLRLSGWSLRCLCANERRAGMGDGCNMRLAAMHSASGARYTGSRTPAVAVRVRGSPAAQRKCSRKYPPPPNSPPGDGPKA
jgi:hypothetical protein